MAAPVSLAPGAARPVATIAPDAPRARFSEVLSRQLSPPGASPPAHGAAAAALDGVRGLEEARARLDAALAAARRGRTFSPQELLAIQSAAYRFQHGVEVASRIAEAGAQSVKQAVNTQV